MEFRTDKSVGDPLTVQCASRELEIGNRLPFIRIEVCLATSLADKSQLETLCILKTEPQGARLFDRPTEGAARINRD